MPLAGRAVALIPADLLDIIASLVPTGLACYSAAGFHDDLRTANQDRRLAVVTLDDIYA